MGFDKNIIDDCMVKSARHCCVCHRYRGVKLEVHHIIPKKQNGTDTEENAIPLCFDCHADAGHYHAEHPKGKKLSPEELKKHKNNWYKQVSEGKIPQRKDLQSCWFVRHLVCKNWNAICEITNGDFQYIPISSPLILKNDVFSYLEKIIKNYQNSLRSLTYNRSYFSTKEEILNKYSEAIDIDSKNKEFQSYKIIRPIYTEDIEDSNDFLSKKILESGILPNQIGEVFYYEEKCGSCGNIQEMVRFRNINLLLLAVENISDDILQLESFKGPFNQSKDFIPVKYSEAISYTAEDSRFPSMLIKPKQTVLIPQAILLEPLEGYNPESIREEVVKIEHYGGIHFSHVVEKNNWQDKVEIIGPYNIVNEIFFLDTQKEGKNLPIHQFDFSNLYLIQKYWYCGSCPHIFVKNIYNNKWNYLTDTLTGSAKDEIYIHEINDEVDQIRIWEIEDEVSYFKNIDIFEGNNNLIKSLSNLKLNKEEYIYIELKDKVNFPIKLKISGYYTPLTKTSTEIEAIQYRNILIKKALKRLNNPQIEAFI